MKNNTNFAPQPKHGCPPSAPNRASGIDLWCFLFSFVILFNHLKTIKQAIGGPTLLQNGYIAVGFYFITSGYLMVHSALRSRADSSVSLGESTWVFLFKKVRSFAFFFIIGWICAFLERCVAGTAPTYPNALYMIWEPLMMYSSGVGGIYLNAPAWYLSSMILFMLIAYPLCRKFGETYYFIIAPVTAFVLMGTISRTTGGLQGGSWYGFPLLGDDIARGALGISMGAVSYAIAHMIKKHHFNIPGKILLSVVELLGYVGTIVVMADIWGTTMDFLGWSAFCISVAITFSKASYLTYFYNLLDGVAPFLRKFSTAMFLNHWWVIRLVADFGKGNAYLTAHPLRGQLFVVVFCTVWSAVLVFAEIQFSKIRTRNK